MKSELYEAFLVDGVPVRFEPRKVYWWCVMGYRNDQFGEGLDVCESDEPHGDDCHWAVKP